jgi:SAM-dependent methyltransferase
MSALNAHYDDAYYAAWAKTGDFGAVANLRKFARFIEPHHVVADFGCAGGRMLMNFECRQRIGVEINPAAAAEARARGVEVFASVDELVPESIDVFVSDNALEHVDFPLAVLHGVHRALRPGGVAVFVVPCEHILMRYRADDFDQHLHSWSPGALGNLFKRAGFAVVESRPYIHRWPPGFAALQRRIGWRLWHVAAHVYGGLYWPLIQVRTVGRKA